MSDNAALVDMGYIADAFGVSGWVKVKTATESVSSLASYAQVYLRLKNQQVVAATIAESLVRNDILHVKLAHITDRDAALALRGATIAVARVEFPALATDEYYWVDLIGLTVINQQNEPLGTVKQLLETGANDVLVVNDGVKEHLIPFVAQYIISVAMSQRQIVVDWGLDY